MLSLYLSQPSFTHIPSPKLPLCPSGHELSPTCLPPWMGKGRPVLWGWNLEYHSYWTLTTHLPFFLSLFFKNFWPHCAACGILVPPPKIKPMLFAVEAQFLKKIFIWLHQVLLAALGIFITYCGALVAARGLLSRGVHGLSCSRAPMHVLSRV